MPRISRNIKSSSIMLGLFFATSVWATWPLAMFWRDALPTGDSPTATVPQLNCWIMWWNFASARLGFENYWDAPIFFPSHRLLALSEPLSASILLSPITYMFGSAIPTYNCFLLLCLTLNGFCSWWFLKQQKCGVIASICGGAAVTLHPLALQNLEAVQLIAIWPCIWCLGLLVKFRKSPSPSIGVQMGIAFALQSMLCVHHALFATILLSCAALLVAPFKTPWKALTGYSTALVTATLLTLPFFGVILSTHQEYQTSRNPMVVEALSAKLGDWFTSQNLAWPLIVGGATGDFPLSPGIGRICLIIASIPLLARSRAVARKLLWSLLLLSVVLSFGANLPLGIWEILCDLFRPFQSVRSPYRFAYFAQLATILLGALAFDALLKRTAGTSQTKSLPRKLFRVALAIVLGCVLVTEVVPPRTFLRFPPTSRIQEEWVAYIRKNTKWDAAILCLPLAENSSEISQQRETTWMMYATIHGRPLLNGYSGFTPPGWSDLSRLIRQDAFAPETLERISSRGASFIALRRDLPQSRTYLKSLALHTPQSIHCVYEDTRYQVFTWTDEQESAR